MNEALVNELKQEAKTTRTLLERVPGDHLAWKPHPKSMSLGQLAFHIARVPGRMTQVAQLSEFDLSNASATQPMPASTEEILSVFDRSVTDAQTYFAALTPETAAAPWRMVLKEREMLSVPRSGMLRTLLLNHLYHHRGQLSVYLRLLDVPVPVIYGRSADEGPTG